MYGGEFIKSSSTNYTNTYAKVFNISLLVKREV